MVLPNKHNKTSIIQQINTIADSNMFLLERIGDFVYYHINPSPRYMNHDTISDNIRENTKIIVPIVCDDVIEYITQSGESLSIQDFICEKCSQTDENVLNAMRRNLFNGVSLYENGRNESFFLYNKIKEGVNDGSIRLKPFVKNFLSNGNFPLIVTTFGFPVIENELSKNKYSSIWYNPNYRNDIPFINSIQSHVVYHIFGGESNTSWVYNEQTLLKFIHSLHSGDYGAKNLSNYLHGDGSKTIKRPLILGSNLPNWLFRFFIYPMYEEKIAESNGYWLSLDDIENELDQFLARNKFLGQTNLRKENKGEQVLQAASIALEKSELGTKREPKIFVSYKREQNNSEEYKTFMRIINLLRQQGQVWLDTNEVSDGGNPYWAHIKDAVKNCDIFIPIVTERYLEEYRDSKSLSEHLKTDIFDASTDSANDTKEVQDLPPIIREAYYAIAYKKKSSPIVIKNNNLNAGVVERIARDNKDTRNIPTEIFMEHTLLEHDDDNPSYFNLPEIE